MTFSGLAVCACVCVCDDRCFCRYSRNHHCTETLQLLLLHRSSPALSRTTWHPAWGVTGRDGDARARPRAREGLSLSLSLAETQMFSPVVGAKSPQQPSAAWRSGLQ